MDNQGFELPIMLSGTLVGLGPLQRELLGFYTRWMNDIEVTHSLGVIGPLTDENEQEWFDNVSRSSSAVFFTIYELATARPIGTASLSEINYRTGTATFGIMIGERDCWNRGYGTEATRIVLEYGFFMLNLNNILLTVFNYNHRGYRAYEKAGFKIIGRRREAIRMFGKAHDVILMDALASDFSDTKRVCLQLQQIQQK